MKWFKESEFQGFYDKIDKEFLEKIDALREVTGFTMIVSPANGAVGRSDSVSSWHNYRLHGAIYATDFFVSNKGKNLTKREILLFKTLAIAVGLKGIGLYPYWRGPVGTGFHLDNRTKLTNKVGRSHDSWGRLKDNSYVTFDEALKHIK